MPLRDIEHHGGFTVQGSKVSGLFLYQSVSMTGRVHAALPDGVGYGEVALGDETEHGLDGPGMEFYKAVLRKNVLTCSKFHLSISTDRWNCCGPYH